MIEPTREWEIKGDKCFNKDLEAMVKKTRREKKSISSTNKSRGG